MKAARTSGKAGKNKAEDRQPPQPPKRAFAPRTLSTLLPGVTKEAFRKRSPATVTLFLDWSNIVGESLARRTEPRKLGAGTLTIACHGPVAMEIQHMQAALINRINMWCGQKIVERLRLTQDFQPTTPKPRAVARQSAPLTPPDLPDFPEGPLRDALEALGTRLAERRNRRS